MIPTRPLPARVVLNEGDQPKVLISNFKNARKVAQKELKSECVSPNNNDNFPEDEMYSIQLQMAGLEEPEDCMHKCPHPASNILQTLNCYFSKLCFVHDLVLRNIAWQL